MDKKSAELVPDVASADCGVFYWQLGPVDRSGQVKKLEGLRKQAARLHRAKAGR